MWILDFRGNITYKVSSFPSRRLPTLTQREGHSCTGSLGWRSPWLPLPFHRRPFWRGGGRRRLGIHGVSPERRDIRDEPPSLAGISADLERSELGRKHPGAMPAGLRMAEPSWATATRERKLEGTGLLTLTYPTSEAREVTCAVPSVTNYE